MGSQIQSLPNRFIDGISQVCIVVTQFERAVQELALRFGIGPFKCWHYKPPRLFHTTFRGEEALWTMKLGITWIGKTQLEVIQPLEGPSLYQQYLQAHGEGIHHLMVTTGNRNFNQAMERFVSAGFSAGQGARLKVPIQIGPFTLPPLPRRLDNLLGTQIVYLATEESLKTVLELVKLPPWLFRLGLKIGKPDYWVPADQRDFHESLPHHFISQISKIGFVTRDLDQTIRSYADRVGIGPWKVYTLGSAQLSRLKMRGQETRFRVRLALTKVGDKLLEIVQPLEGHSFYQEILETSGEGIHYLGITPGELPFSRAIERFLALGCPVAMEGSIENCYRFSFLETKLYAATALELISIPFEEIPEALEQVKSYP